MVEPRLRLRGVQENTEAAEKLPVRWPGRDAAVGHRNSRPQSSAPCPPASDWRVWRILLQGRKSQGREASGFGRDQLHPQKGGEDCLRLRRELSRRSELSAPHPWHSRAARTW